MSEEGKTNPLKLFFTVITSPIWVPVAGVAGLVTAPVRGIIDSVEYAEENGESDAEKATKGIATAPGFIIGRAVTGPFEMIGDVGKMMSKK